MFSQARTHDAAHPAVSIGSISAPPEPSRRVPEATRYRRGEIVCRQGYPASHWYQVTSGVVTRYVISSDGRRRLLDLLLPGDYFGFLRHGEHRSTCEAMTDNTDVVRYPLDSIANQFSSDASQGWQFYEALIEALSRLDNHLLVVGRVTASEKVGSFLLDIERRGSRSAAGIQLPMSRYDIADYLGLSVETVSRALSDLTSRGCIQLNGPRAVKIVDRDALAAGEADMRSAP